MHAVGDFNRFGARVEINPQQRRASISGIAFFVALFLLISSPILFAGDAAPTVASLKEAANAASASGDDPALLAALEALYKSDPSDGLDFSLQLLTRGLPHQRPVAVEMLVRRCTAKQLGFAAQSVRRDLYPDERRQLVRALGTHKPNAAVPVIKDFLRDQDTCVKAAAASALGDMTDPKLVELLLSPVPSLLNYTEVDGEGDDLVYSDNALGSIIALSRLHPENSQAIEQWWRDGAPNPTGVAPTFLQRADGKIMSPSFEIEFDPQEAKAALINSLNLGSEDDLKKLVSSMEIAATQDRALMKGIFGTLHIPICRIVFATQQTIAASGGVSEGYEGFGGDGKITFNTPKLTPLGFQIVMRHEFIHILHRTQFRDQPRWLSEGLAVSMSESPRASHWSGRQITAAGLDNIIQAGGVSADLKWINSLSSGGTETQQYQLSGLVFDYLRFGNFSLPRRRLFALMGQLNRGVPAERVIPEIYGRSLSEMDADFAKWVAMLTPAVVGPSGNLLH